MKAKTPAPSKKKAGTGAAKKTLSTSKKKSAAAAAKKRPAAASRKKPVSLAQRKLELHRQVRDFVSAAFNKDRRMAYFVSSADRKDGAYIMCFAVEGEAGYYKADWGWHCSLATARTETALMNKKLGLNEEEVNRIIISTMGPADRQKK